MYIKLFTKKYNNVLGFFLEKRNNLEKYILELEMKYEIEFNPKWHEMSEQPIDKLMYMICAYEDLVRKMLNEYIPKEVNDEEREKLGRYVELFIKLSH